MENPFGARTLSALALALILAPAVPLVAAPREDAGPAPDAAAHWDVLAARSAEPAAVAWSARTGGAHAIYGAFSAPSAGVSERTARRFLADTAPLFRLRSDLLDLVLVRSFDSPMGRHFVFEQRHRGVRVHGAEVAVHFDGSGRVVAATSTALPGLALRSVRPAVPFARARDAVLAALGARPSDRGHGELVVHDDGRTGRLAWRIVVLTESRTWEAFVDARGGSLIGQPKDINRYATGTGQVFADNAVVATRDNTLRDNDDSAAAVPASAYVTVTLQGLADNGFLDGTYASSSRTKKRVSSASNTFVFDRSSDGFSETMGYYYLDFAERYIQSLGFANVNNRQQVFSVNRLKVDNSFYSPSSKDITYGLGGVDDAEDAEVILHEYGHSIQDDQVPGFGSGPEAGAMGEGFGDYWGGSVGAQFSGGFQDTCVADWDATSYSSTSPPCLRRLDTTKHYPEDVVGEVHADGEIWSAALWQIRGAIGAAKADTLILQHHFLLATDATFNEAATALVTTAKSLGYKKAEVNSIRTILQSRGFTVTT